MQVPIRQHNAVASPSTRPQRLAAVDVDKLMLQLEALGDADNTVIVAEHAMRVAAAADWIFDLGPGASADVFL